MQLVLGVAAVNVKAWIGFCKTKFLRAPESIAKAPGFFDHPRQNEISGPIDDAIKSLDPVRRQTLCNCFDDGNTTGNTRLETQLALFLSGKLVQIWTPSA